MAVTCQPVMQTCCDNHVSADGVGGHHTTGHAMPPAVGHHVGHPQGACYIQGASYDIYIIEKYRNL